MTEIATLEHRLSELEHVRETIGDDAYADIRSLLLNQIEITKNAINRREQRKYVTLLFADISGYTALSKDLDSEYVKRQIMDPLWQQLDHVIQNHGGYIDKHMGDGLMAVFGTPTAQENDPERAVQAGLSMHSILGVFCRDADVQLSLRIGIHSGHVFLGQTGVTQEYTAYGDTVNTASRLESAAPKGGILISDDTWQHVRGLFVVNPLKPLIVKGKEEEPLTVYEVVQTTKQDFHGPIRNWDLAPMVGRESELRRLQDSILTAVEQSRLQFLTIVGESGIGKTRLLLEFSQWLAQTDPTICYFKARATHPSPFSLVRAMITTFFNIHVEDSPATIKAKVEDGIIEILGDTSLREAHLIGALLGLPFANSPFLPAFADSSKQLFDQGLIGMRELLVTLSRRQPVAIFLEEIHWADESSLTFLMKLAQLCRDAPILIVALTRPSLFSNMPHWGEGYRFHDQINLQKLSQRDSRRLLEALCQQLDIELLESTQSLILETADGNPFFLEELLQMKGEDTELNNLPTGYEQSVPATLFGILQARLDKLELSDLITLQQAAVVGRIFWDEVVANLQNREITEPDLSEQFARLRQKRYVEARQHSSFRQTREYSFYSSLLRDTAYETVLSDTKEKYHAHIANWLISRYRPERSLEHVQSIALHLERAGKVSQAVSWYVKGGIEATHRHALAEAESLLQHSLTLLPERSENEATRTEIHTHLGRIYSRRLRFKEATAQYEQILPMVPSPSKIAAQVTLYLAEAQAWQGHYQDSLESALAAEKIALALGPQGKQLVAQAWDRQGWNFFRLRQFEQARELAQKTLLRSKSLKAAKLAADALYLLTAVDTDLGDTTKAFNQGKLALKIYRPLNDLQGEMRVLTILGVIAYDLGDYTNAIEYYRESLALAQATANLNLEVTSLYNIGEACIQLDAWTEAAHYLELATAQEAARELSFFPLILAAAAWALANLDQPEAARGHIEEAIYIAEASGQPYFRQAVWRSLGQIVTTSKFDSRVFQQIEILTTFDEADWPGMFVQNVESEAFANSISIALDAGMKNEAKETLTLWLDGSENQTNVSNFLKEKLNSIQ